MRQSGRALVVLQSDKGTTVTLPTREQPPRRIADSDGIGSGGAMPAPAGSGLHKCHCSTRAVAKPRIWNSTRRVVGRTGGPASGRGRITVRLVAAPVYAQSPLPTEACAPRCVAWPLLTVGRP